REHLPRPLEVDDRVDHHVCDVYALGPDLAGDRFREDPLCRFGRREAREAGLPADRRGVAGGDDGALSRRDHRRSEPSGQMPPREKRRTIAAPVPGPTPVTTTTGFAMPPPVQNFSLVREKPLVAASATGYAMDYGRHE